MTYSRELERKYIVDMNSVAAEFRLNVMFPGAESSLRGRSKDTFWEAPGVDFIRLRDNTRELTIKITDKGTIEDRVEENVVVNSINTTRRILNVLYGPHTIELWKNYYVLKLGDCHISLYTVDGLEQVFLEVEH
jgi:adenylate cyclase class IV